MHVGLLDRAHLVLAACAPARRRRGRRARSRSSCRPRCRRRAACRRAGSRCRAARRNRRRRCSSRTIMRSRPATTSRLERAGVDQRHRTPSPGAGWRTGPAPCAGAGGRARASDRSGRSSHFGPPTAPNSTASASSARCIVSSVIGVPCASSAAPPTRSSSTSKATGARPSSRSRGEPRPSPRGRCRRPAGSAAWRCCGPSRTFTSGPESRGAPLLQQAGAGAGSAGPESANGALRATR